MVKTMADSVYIATRNIMTRRRMSEPEASLGMTDRELWEALDQIVFDGSMHERVGS